MNPYEKLIKTMREEAKNGVDMTSFGLATMTGEKTLTYNGMEFEEDDCLFADHLLKPRLEVLDFENKKNIPIPDDEEHHYHKWKDNSTYIEPLKSGDTVFGILIDTDDDQKFLVLCRVGG
jgi:hypothetical protein